MMPTNFHGDAKVPNGPAGCRARCTQWGLEFAGMVAMGEYSDGCICQVPSKPAQPISGAQAAAAGVVTQMQTQAEAAQRQQFQQH